MIDMSCVLSSVPGVSSMRGMIHMSCMRVFRPGMMLIVHHLRTIAIMVVMVVRGHLDHTKTLKSPGKDLFPGRLTA